MFYVQGCKNHKSNNYTVVPWDLAPLQAIVLPRHEIANQKLQITMINAYTNYIYTEPMRAQVFSTSNNSILTFKNPRLFITSPKVNSKPHRESPNKTTKQNADRLGDNENRLVWKGLPCTLESHSNQRQSLSHAVEVMLHIIM